MKKLILCFCLIQILTATIYGLEKKAGIAVPTKKQNAKVQKQWKKEEFARKKSGQKNLQALQGLPSEQQVTADQSKANNLRLPAATHKQPGR